MEPTPTESAAYQATAESLQSTFHEQVVEHIFIAELLQEAWLRYNKVVEVMRSEVDAYGYDLVLECEGVMRHVQLKTSKHDAATAYQKVGLALGTKPSGCVIWLLRTHPENTVRFELRYLFFGNGPGHKIPDLLAKSEDGKTDLYPAARHTKRNAAGERTIRPAIRQVKRKFFQPFLPAKDGMAMQELFVHLFGSPA